ncbi:MAG: glycosyltransferase family 4 protein [Dongiaceae bacterium]
MSEAPFRAVVSHPSKQGNMYRVPLGALRSGIPTDFLTGFYYRPGDLPWQALRLLPAARRDRAVATLERRRLAGLDERVTMVSGPLPELLYRWLGYDAGNALHDRLASRWLARHVRPGSRGIFHGFQESCGRSLATARRRGLVTLLESTLPPSTLPLVAAEYARLGQPWTGPSAPSALLLGELPRADYVVAQSRFAQRSLAEYGVAPGRVLLMPLGVDVARFRPAPPAAAGAARPFRVLFAGQMSVRKGVHHLLEAWSRLDLPDAELLFAGAPRDAYIQDLLKRQRGRVRPLGFVPHARLHEVYQQADLFVFPSLAEGGVYVIYEALACGLPCIVSANAGSAVRDGTEGFVLPVGDVAALAERIAALAADPAARRRMAEAARARAEHFSWENFYRRIGLMYRAAVARGGAPFDAPLDLFER